MISRKYLSLIGISLIVCALSLVGCVETAGSPTPVPEVSSADAFKVALILPGEIDDNGWSQAGYEGIQLIEKELGAEVAYTASVPEAETEQIFRQYAAAGFDFIIGHGGEYIPGAEVVAEEFPEIQFAVMAGYAGNNKNLGALSFRDGELGYLAGVVAALKTTTNKVGYIGGVPYPHIQEQATLFERGAQTIRPEVEVSVGWVESWTDQAKVEEIALAQIEAGVDVFVVSVDAAGLVAFEIAAEKGIYAIGWALDQHDLAPNTILTSAIQNLPILYLEGATLVQLDRWEGKQYKFGLQEGAQALAPFYGLLTEAQEEQVTTARDDIITGKIDVTP